MRMWMIVTVETAMPWPAQEMRVRFVDHDLLLRPPDGENAPDVCIEYDHPGSEREAYETVCRFLSCLSWRERQTARACLRLGCTGGPTLRGGWDRCQSPLLADYVDPNASVPSDPKARLALALYREALGVRHTPYEFLGYFKILNVLYPHMADQVTWINRSLHHVTEARAKARAAQLALLHADVGEYLYVSGRCAVAHAFKQPLVDPDSPEDVFRLADDALVVRALAEYLMEHELGLKQQGRA